MGNLTRLLLVAGGFLGSEETTDLGWGSWRSSGKMWEDVDEILLGNPWLGGLA